MWKECHRVLKRFNQKYKVWLDEDLVLLNTAQVQVESKRILQIAAQNVR